MPRLVGHRERLPFNLYDCLTYGAGRLRRGLPQPAWRMFGNANVGNLRLTNMVVPGQMQHDMTAIVTNWYARTNIPEGPLRDALFTPVMATLSIGSKPQRVMSVAELLRRQEGTLFDLHEPGKGEDERIEALEALARLSYEAHAHHGGADESLHPLGGFAAETLDGDELGDVLDIRTAAAREQSGQSRSWEDLEDAERGKWYAVADAVYRELHPWPYLIIPVRQNFSVQIDIFNLEHFNQALVKLDDPNWDADGNRIHLLSAPKGHPADHPGVWIHLEGWLSRDVC